MNELNSNHNAYWYSWHHYAAAINTNEGRNPLVTTEEADSPAPKAPS